MEDVDYTGATRAHLEIARRYASPLLLGPPMSEDLLALVRHMYSEEEAELVRHLKVHRPATAVRLSRASGIPLEEARRILKTLAHEKFVLGFFGKADAEKYVLLPLVPGTFEMVLMRASKDTVTPWHRRFAELFEALFSTGFAADYMRVPIDSVRYIPVGEALPAVPEAMPCDRLESILERYDRFAIGVCQCRLSKGLVGEGCGRLLETCTAFGDGVPMLVREGKMREASMRDVIEVKREAESQGLVTWMFNVDYDARFNGSCSCCGCCCGALRSITEFNTTGFISPPRYVPVLNTKECNLCGACGKVCPTGAMAVEESGGQKRHAFRSERCIGCGLCAVSCKQDALTLEENADFFELPRNWNRYLLRYAPAFIRNVLHTWRDRR